MKLKTLSAIAALSMSIAGAKAAQAQDITLQMVVWNYSIDTIQANLKDFEAANPGIKVQLTD